MDKNIARVKELEKWFLTDYMLRLEHIRRCRYLGVVPDETEQSLQEEAYQKEQELRALLKKPPLGEIKNKICI